MRSFQQTQTGERSRRGSCNCCAGRDACGSQRQSSQGAVGKAMASPCGGEIVEFTWRRRLPAFKLPHFVYEASKRPHA